jgi:RNA polymerase sigma-70 factor (ECF subfamily)
LVADRVSAAAAGPALAAALAGLSSGDRDVLLLVAVAGLDNQEVALSLGIPHGTVRSRLSRARQRLRESLGGANPAESIDPVGGIGLAGGIGPARGRKEQPHG